MAKAQQKETKVIKKGKKYMKKCLKDAKKDQFSINLHCKLSFSTNTTRKPIQGVDYLRGLIGSLAIRHKVAQSSH